MEEKKKPWEKVDKLMVDRIIDRWVEWVDNTRQNKN